MQLVNQHARPPIIQVGCPTCCYQVCALDHANVGTADLDYSSGPCHRNEGCREQWVDGFDEPPLSPLLSSTLAGVGN